MYVPCSGKFSRGSVFTDVHRCATTFMYNHVYFVNLTFMVHKATTKIGPLENIPLYSSKRCPPPLHQSKY